jgi:REP element-mobilizing transposase RayT
MAGTYTNLLYHVVFSTRQRRPLITEKIERSLHKYMGGVIRNQKGVLLEINGMPDHVHLFFKLKPTIAISNIVRDIKANSAHWLNDSRKLTVRFAWQDGYSAFTVSESQVERVKAYIRNQKQHHRRNDYRSELLTLLEKHRIEYEERYLWD